MGLPSPSILIEVGSEVKPEGVVVVAEVVHFYRVSDSRAAEKDRQYVVVLGPASREPGLSL